MEGKKAEAALWAIAAREGISVEDVRANIQEAIDIGMSNPDPLIKQFWESIPCRGEYPSPEELICFLSKRVSSFSGMEDFGLWS